MEFIEHTIALYHSVLDRLYEENSSLDSILDLENYRNRVELTIGETARFGEVRQHLQHGLAARGRERLDRILVSLLDLRYRRAELSSRRRLNFAVIVLTAVGAASLIEPVRRALQLVGDVTQLTPVKTEVVVWLLAFGTPFALVALVLLTLKLFRRGW